MSYFNVFPLFTLQDGSIGINITARTKIMSALKSDPAAYYVHNVTDGETPEIIADKFYGEAELAWTILLFNEIHNVYTDWPLDSYSLDQYIDSKYENPYEIHHYVSIATGNIVGSDHVTYDRFPVTNQDYEVELNDSKRKINLIVPELISSVVLQHKNQMNGK
jgi:hypothetical protein